METDGLVLTRAQARTLDRRAIEEHGLPALVLMENAGRACADEALAMLGSRPRGPVLVLCGPGNNGGDGLVVARTLFNRGVEARVLCGGSAAALETGSAEVVLNARLWRGLGRAIEPVPTEADARARRADLGSAALLVDALFGVGPLRPLTGPWAALVEEANASRRPILAVDLPSGLDADTGEVQGVAVRATTTVTFVAPKRGLLVGRGPACAGRVVVAEIGVPRGFLDELSASSESSARAR